MGKYTDAVFLSSADAEFLIGKIAAYVKGGGFVKETIGKGAKKINPKQKYDLSNLGNNREASINLNKVF